MRDYKSAAEATSLLSSVASSAIKTWRTVNISASLYIFCKTAHLPLPWANTNTYFSLTAKCWLRGGVGEQFPQTSIMIGLARGEKLSWERGVTLPAESTKKHPLKRALIRHHCPNQKLATALVLWLPCLDRVEPVGRAKVFIWRTVGRARELTLPSPKGNPTRNGPNSDFSLSTGMYIKKRSHQVRLHIKNTSLRNGQECLNSLRSGRLEVVGARENGHAQGRHARGEGAPSPLTCLLLAR